MNLEQVKKYLELAEKMTGIYKLPPQYVIIEGQPEYTEFLARSLELGPALAKALLRAVEELECAREAFDFDRNKYARQEITKALSEIEKILP